MKSSNMMTYHPQKGRGHGHLTVLKFRRLPRCSASRGFVSDTRVTDDRRRQTPTSKTILAHWAGQ